MNTDLVDFGRKFMNEDYICEWGGTPFNVISKDGMKCIDPEKDIPDSMPFRKLQLFDANGDVMCETVHNGPISV